MDLNDIIDENLQVLDQYKFQSLCDELVCNGAFGKEFEEVIPLGVSAKRNKTIKGTPDSIMFLDKNNSIVFEYTTNQNFSRKLKDDLEKVKEKVENEGFKITKFIFITNGERTKLKYENKSIFPEQFIKEKYGWSSKIIDVKTLRLVLDKSDYFYIRRKYLSIPIDYFQSSESFFEQEFRKRVEKNMFFTKDFKGREKEIDSIKNFVLESDKQILLIYSQGGIGKTRLIFETAKEMEKDISFNQYNFLFNRKRGSIDISEHLHELSNSKINIVILDNAHEIGNLRDFQNILLQKPNSKIVLTIRSTAREKVISDIGSYEFDIEEFPVKRLDNKVIYSLLKENSKKEYKKELLEYITSLCEGNPLLAEIYLWLINKNRIKTISDMKENKPLKTYFHEILNDIEKNTAIITTQYKPYLALIFIVKPFSINDLTTRKTIRQIISLDEVEENSFIRNLKSTGIIEQIGDTLWVYPDLLGEYIVKDAFFSDTPLLKFENIFERLSFENKKSALKTLREIDTEKSSLFLKKFAADFEWNIEKQNNDQRIKSLNLLEIIAFRVPDEVLKVTSSIVKGTEKPAIKYRKPFSYLGETHNKVLLKCLEILDIIKYRNFEEVIAELIKYYFYKLKEKDYKEVREKAEKIIVGLAGYDLYVLQEASYSYQQKILKKVKEWKNKDFEKHLDLVLQICKAILGVEFESQYSSPIRPMEFTLIFGPLVVSEELRNMRKDTICFLKEIFVEAKNERQQVDIIKTFETAMYLPTRGKYGKDMKEMILTDTETIVDFYITVLPNITSPIIKKEIEKQAYLIKLREEEKLPKVDNLIENLRKDEFYSLYRILVGNDLDYEFVENNDWEGKRKEREKKIKDIVRKIHSKNYRKWVEKFNRIASTYDQKENYEFLYFEYLLSELGSQKPEITKFIIDESITKNTALKIFVPKMIRGIRESKKPEIADDYVRKWLESKDKEFIPKIPQTYSVLSKNFREKDLEILEQLSKQEDNAIDLQIVILIPSVYNIAPKRCCDIIQKIADRANNNVLQNIARYILSKNALQKIDIKKWDKRYFTKLIWNFIRLSHLDWHVISGLANYGKRFPLKLVDFFKERIDKKIQKKTIFFNHYNIIPLHISEISKMYLKHPLYPKVIDKIFRWFKRKEWIYQREGKYLITRISPNLDERLRKKLQEYISTGEKDKIIITVKILNRYEGKEFIYDLCKEAIRESKGDEDVCREVKVAIIQTGTLAGERGLINNYEAKIKLLKDWTKDEDTNVNVFAEKTIESLKIEIKNEEKDVAEQKIRMQKGV